MDATEAERIRSELDRLCELANVGAGHAAGALARLLGCTVWMDPPRVRVVRRGEEAGGALAASTSGVFFAVEGAIGGTFGVLFPQRARESLLLALLGDPDPHSEEAESALREVGNMLASHALSAVADLIGDRVLPSLPVLAEEGAGAVLGARQARGEPVRIESRLVDGAGGLRSLLVWVPAPFPSEAPPPDL
ncbi:MAG: chemotaxis protein CheC [Deltaproteobacteria bacterium]|nr:chemotaxis protein CheC [Deltaproteobacteria bacterium]